MPDPTDPTPEELILANALAPKKASGDQGSAEQHPIADQIAALELSRQAEARRRPRPRGLGVRHVKLVPPGMD